MKVKDIFKKHGLEIQATSYTCGPCTLLNVLRIKRKSAYNEKELAILCETKADHGTTNETMVKVARQIGLDVTKVKADSQMKDIEQDLDRGCIVVVSYQHLYSGEGHYAIITEHDDEAFYFRDCSAGFFRLRKPLFDKVWYGSDGIKRWYMAIN